MIDTSGGIITNAGVLIRETADLATLINKESYKLPVILDNLNLVLKELTLTLDAINRSPLINAGYPEEENKTFGRKIRSND